MYSPTCLAPDTIATTVSTFSRLTNRINTATFIPVIGMLTQTKLPKAAIDKLLIDNSLHEFSDPDSILTDIRTCLKPGGTLFILENLTTKSGTLHQVQTGRVEPDFVRLLSSYL